VTNAWFDPAPAEALMLKQLVATTGGYCGMKWYSYPSSPFLGRNSPRAGTRCVPNWLSANSQTP